MQRRNFLKATSGLVIAFTLSATAKANTAAATPKSMRKQDVAAWLELGADGRATVYSGKVDLGTGVQTALTQMVADELDLPFDRIDMVMGDTGQTIDQGQTAGSLSISVGGKQLREACATARQAVVAKAAATWGVKPDDIVLTGDGMAHTRDRTRSAPYASLLAGGVQTLQVDAKAPLKKPSEHRWVGRSIPRVDIPDKLTGAFTYIHDLRLPGMLHARVIRPAGIGSKLLGYDEAPVRGISGYLQTVRKGDFLAVVAKTEWAAVQAARDLKVRWSDWKGLPTRDQMYAVWRGQKVVKTEPRQQRGSVTEGIAQASKKLAATYEFTIHSHASMGPSCAVASFSDGRCEIWSPSQATHSLQSEVALLLDMPKDRVRLHYVDGSGCYGRNGHEDCTGDAALVAKLTGATVRVQWSRDDEHGWDPKSPPTVVDLQAGVDAAGNVSAWQSTFILSAQNGTLDDFPLLAAVHSGQTKKGHYTGNIAHNSDVEYAFPNTLTRVDRVDNVFLRTSHLRTPGRMQNNFANEAFFDEVAAAAGKDPVALRLQYLKDPRSRAVVEGAARAAGWVSRPAHSAPNAGNIARGRGFAYIRYQNEHTYVGMVCDVAVDRTSGKITVEKVTVSHDCGQVINPDGTINQIEGGIVQTISRTLIEDVSFDASRVTSTDWASYPIITFPDVPQIHVELINRPKAPPWGAGEMAPAVVPAAISNAVFDAIGVRLRSVPFVPERVLAGLAAARKV